jgi:predicted lactoylglutathione lyase
VKRGNYLHEFIVFQETWMLMSFKGKTNATLGHVCIEVSNLENSRKFYEVLLNKLDFKVIMDTKETVGFSNKVFNVWLVESREPRVRREAPTGEESVVADHLAILVNSKQTVDAVADEMKQKGFVALFPPEEHAEFQPGYYAVSFCDSDNYVTEVYTSPARKQ